MGWVDRMRRVTAGRIEAFLDSLEDPAAMAPLLLREMDGQIEALARAEAKALAAVTSAQRRVNEAIGQVARLGRGAELALRYGEETTARDALARQVALEKNVALAEEEAARAEKALADARAARTGLEQQRADLRRRAADLARRARQTKRGRTALAVADEARRLGATALDMVARMEARGEAVEPEPATRAGTDASLMERLGRIERMATVEERMDALRRSAKTGGANPAPKKNRRANRDE